MHATSLGGIYTHDYDEWDEGGNYEHIEEWF